MEEVQIEESLFRDVTAEDFVGEHGLEVGF